MVQHSFNPFTFVMNLIVIDSLKFMTCKELSFVKFQLQTSITYCDPKISFNFKNKQKKQKKNTIC